MRGIKITSKLTRVQLNRLHRVADEAFGTWKTNPNGFYRSFKKATYVPTHETTGIPSIVATMQSIAQCQFTYQEVEL